MGKIDVKNMDLYYSSFHALKNINLEIPEEASFGLGAGKLRTVFKVVLPSAIPWNPFRCGTCDRTYCW